ncbi:MAG TPA: beta-glucosidase BglX [Opitutaceae bacterium]|jgi:beta-glucosidase
MRTPACLLLAGLALIPLQSRADGLGSHGAEARVDALLARMTVDEEIGQVSQFAADAFTGPGQPFGRVDELVKQGKVGSLFNVVVAKETNAYQHEAVDGSRLHIPLLFGYDIIHGFHTLFPIPLGLSASWDPELVEATARQAAREACQQGVRWTFSPMVDIARDARWGRITEGAGEDPFLGAAFARAYVRGYQGERLSDPGSILACAKHFVGYGAAEGGREYNTTEISERTLRGVYLPPFHAAVEAGAGTLMSAFNSLDGVPASANHFTLTDVLKDEWGFKGFVVSDWTSVKEIMLHGIADDERTAARKSFMAGVDMDMQSGLFLAQLPALVRSGEVPKSRLDDAVRRILRVKYALGLFDSPYADAAQPAAAISAPARELARRAAEESFVLLRNQAVGRAPLLPLDPGRERRIALIGPLADSAPDMLGSWPGASDAANVVTLRSALAARSLRDGFRVDFAQGTKVLGNSTDGFKKAVAAARSADVVVLALGENAHSSGEASARSTLGLEGNQEELLKAVCAAGKPVVLVLFNGRPLTIPWAAGNVPAILEAWFPGLEAGPAVVETLFGDSSPSGRLTASFPRSVGQEPIYYDTLNTGRPRNDPIGMGATKPDPYYVTGYIDEPNTPLFPFGWGLTYTSFEYSPAAADTRAVSASDIMSGKARITVTCEVRNTGPRAGTETAQLYIRERGTSVARPVRELKGFQRVRLGPGESRRLEFTLGRHELSFWNIDMKDVVEPASLYLWVAPDSTRGEPVRVDLTQ